MNDNESISEIFTRFTDIINGLKAVDKDIPSIELVNKILRSLLKSWKPKATTILEAKNLTKLELDQLISSFITHEMINFTNDDQKKKGLALKASPHGDDYEEINDKDFELLSRKFKMFSIKRRQGVVRIPKQESKDVINCHKCKYSRHVMANFPLMRNINKKKQTMCATDGMKLMLVGQKKYPTMKRLSYPLWPLKIIKMEIVIPLR